MLIATEHCGGGGWIRNTCRGHAFHVRSPGQYAGCRTGCAALQKHIERGLSLAPLEYLDVRSLVILEQTTERASRRRLYRLYEMGMLIRVKRAPVLYQVHPDIRLWNGDCPSVAGACRDMRAEAMRALQSGARTTSQVARALDVPHRRARNMLQRMERDGDVRQSGVWDWIPMEAPCR